MMPNGRANGPKPRPSAPASPRRRAAGEADRARAELDRIDRERQAELDRLERALGSMVETRRNGAGSGHESRDAIEFEFGSAELGRSDRERLSRITGVRPSSSGLRSLSACHASPRQTMKILTDQRRQALHGVRTAGAPRQE